MSGRGTTNSSVWESRAAKAVDVVREGERNGMGLSRSILPVESAYM